MANAGDPLLDLLSGELDERAVSALVGSLESRLGHAGAAAQPVRGVGRTSAANRHGANSGSWAGQGQENPCSPGTATTGSPGRGGLQTGNPGSHGNPGCQRNPGGQGNSECQGNPGSEGSPGDQGNPVSEGSSGSRGNPGSPGPVRADGLRGHGEGLSPVDVRQDGDIDERWAGKKIPERSALGLQQHTVGVPVVRPANGGGNAAFINRTHVKNSSSNNGVLGPGCKTEDVVLGGPVLRPALIPTIALQRPPLNGATGSTPLCASTGTSPGPALVSVSVPTVNQVPPQTPVSTVVANQVLGHVSTHVLTSAPSSSPAPSPAPSPSPGPSSTPVSAPTPASAPAPAPTPVQVPPPTPVPMPSSTPSPAPVITPTLTPVTPPVITPNLVSAHPPSPALGTPNADGLHCLTPVPSQVPRPTNSPMLAPGAGLTLPGVVRVSLPAAAGMARPGLALQQRLLSPQIIAPRPLQQQTIQLPPGFALPPGTVMVRAGEQGQLFLIQQQPMLAQAGAAHLPGSPAAQSLRFTTLPTVTAGTSPSCLTTTLPRPLVTSQIRPPTPTVSINTVAVMSPGLPTPCKPSVTVPTPPPTAALSAVAGQQTIVFTPEVMENVKKCKNFLSTLIKLASSGQQLPETTRNVKELVQSLLDAKVEPEEFTARLQKELKSSPQPHLVPFLKKSLPAVRYLAQHPHASSQTIQVSGNSAASTGITQAGSVTGTPVSGTIAQSPIHTVLSAQTLMHPGGVKQIVLHSPGQPRPTTTSMITRPPQPGAFNKPGVLPCSVRAAGPVHHVPGQKSKVSDGTGGSFRDDDDINDVASMAGVSISEESARILASTSGLVGTQIRSCKDEAFIPAATLHRHMLDIGLRFGVTEIPAEVVSLVSHAAEERLRGVVERLGLIAQHRTESFRVRFNWLARLYSCIFTVTLRLPYFCLLCC
uniref:transcription initiation factor TFIID subunit 4-like n=1 Tax=Myxine glutinosa TaxID=7769 RepID=UPI0035902A9F